MTEKQGGSDVRANTTRAEPLNGGGPGAEYEITGHKWFCSAPMCDAFLVLAQTDAGVSCFLMPRWTPDGERNRFHIQRLKDKLGNRSNASSEVEFRGAWARLIGEEGRGVPTIIEMVNHTRLDCVIGSAAGMRAGVAQAINHAAHRSAFGKLADRAAADAQRARRPLRRVGGGDDLRAAARPRLRRGRGRRRGGPRAPPPRQRRAQVLDLQAGAVARRRVRSSASAATATSRSRGCRASSARARCPRSGRARATSSASTCCGRWSAARASVEAFFAEVGEGAGAEPRLDAFAAKLRDELGSDPETLETRARRVVERMALALQGSLLVRYGDPAVADAFCASRLGGDWGQAFGTLPAGADFGRIVERHSPLPA